MRWFKVISLLLSLSCVSNINAQKEKYQGLLWEISKDGGEKSYLYGTMHVSSKVAFHLTKEFYGALSAVDVVGLETNPDTWLEDMLGSPVYSYALHSGFNIQAFDFYKTYFNLQEINHRYLRYFLSYDSQFSNGLLYRKSMGYQENFQEDTYLDMFIFQAGMKWNKQIVNLEDFHESELLVIESEVAARNALKQNSRYDYDFGEQTPAEIIENAYRNGDLDLLDSIGRITDIEEGRVFMLYKRNENMVRRMDSIISGGQRLFAGVGAAHLPGDEGMIAQLRALGYTVRPVADPTKSDGTEKDEIDEIYYPITMQQAYSGDGMFSTAVPEPFIAPPSQVEFVEYQVPDMANGGNFFVRRINTFGPIFNQDQSFLLKRIDSLLFENIPGKIESLDIEGQDEHGNPIIYIKNKTKQGNYQQYKIFITPFEIYMFKVAGIKAYAVNENVQRFIDEARLHYDDQADWRKVSPYYGGFNVSLPGVVKVQDARDYTSINANALIQSYDKKNDAYFMLLERTLSDFDYLEEDTFELKYIVDQFVDEFKIKDFKEEQWLDWNGKKRYQAHYLDKEGKDIFFQTVVEGPHYYFMIAKSKNKKWVRRAFDSFEVADYQNVVSAHTIVDSSMLFQVQTIAPNPKSVYELLNESPKYKNELKDEEWKSNREFYDYFFTPSGDYLRLSYEKFNDYDFMTKEEAYDTAKILSYIFDGNADYYEFEEILDFSFKNQVMLSEDSILNLKYVRWIGSGEEAHPWKEYLVERNGSSRAIYGRYMVYKDRAYNMSMVVDKEKGPHAFAKAFMDSFTPLDTMVGKDVFLPKDDLFFAHLTGSDSLLRTRAEIAMKEMDFNNKNVNQLMQVLDTLNFKRIDEGFSKRIYWLANADLDTNVFLDYLKDYYLRVGDTSALQMAVLRNLSSHPTPQHYQAYYEMLMKETPLPSNGRLWSLFNQLNDSLALVKSFFPGFYELAAVPEYTEEIYGLLEDLLRDSIITPDFYADKIDFLYREAKMELTRYKNELIEDKESKYNSRVNLIGYYYLGNSKLYNLIKLLKPYYEKDERVKGLMEKMAAIEDIKILYFLSKEMKTYNLVSEASWRHILASDERLKFSVYSALKDLEHEDLLEALHLEWDEIAYSIVNAKLDLKLDKGDSLKLHEIKKMLYQGKEVDLYVYQYKEKNEYNPGSEDWELVILGLMPEEDKVYNDALYKSGITIKKNLGIDKTLEKYLKEYRVMHRERVSKNGNNNYWY